MRSLDPDERALWARVAATITPLSRDRVAPPSPQQSKPGPVDKPQPSQVAAKAPAKPVPAPRPVVANTLDGGWDRRLANGRVEPDRVIDLHGHNLDEAWQAIDRGLEDALVRGERVVLLITGHHRPGDRPVERGKIRAAVNDWLAASRHGRRIAAVRGAHRRHGGGGSLYVILRRQ